MTQQVEIIFSQTTNEKGQTELKCEANDIINIGENTKEAPYIAFARYAMLIAKKLIEVNKKHFVQNIKEDLHLKMTISQDNFSNSHIHVDEFGEEWLDEDFEAQASFVKTSEFTKIEDIEVVAEEIDTENFSVSTELAYNVQEAENIGFFAEPVVFVAHEVYQTINSKINSQ